MGICIFLALPISPIGRIGLISHIFNAYLYQGIVFYTISKKCRRIANG